MKYGYTNQQWAARKLLIQGILFGSLFTSMLTFALKDLKPNLVETLAMLGLLTGYSATLLDKDINVLMFGKYPIEEDEEQKKK